MKKLITATVLVLFAAMSASATVPTADFPPPVGPGIQIAFNSLTENTPIDGWGSSPTSYGWTYDTWAGTAFDNALLRMSPTLQYGAVAPMQEDVDWVFHAEYYHQNDFGTDEAVLFSKHEVTGDRTEDRIFMVLGGSGPNSYQIRVGDATGDGWTTLVTGLPMTEWVDFDVHYRAGAGTMDFYWDGVLVGSGPTGHGRYDVDFIQIEEVPNAPGGQDSWRNFRLAHIPEPGTLALLAIGGLLVVARRRR